MTNLPQTSIHIRLFNTLKTITDKDFVDGRELDDASSCSLDEGDALSTEPDEDEDDALGHELNNARAVVNVACEEVHSQDVLLVRSRCRPVSLAQEIGTLVHSVKVNVR